jgi:hypothetical protein
MPRYKSKTKVEIEAMTDQRLFNAHWWKAIIRHDDMVTWKLMQDELERRRVQIFGTHSQP